MIKQKIPEGLNMYRKTISIEKYDPIRGRTIITNDSFYKYGIPPELLIFQT